MARRGLLADDFAAIADRYDAFGKPTPEGFACRAMANICNGGIEQAIKGYGLDQSHAKELATVILDFIAPSHRSALNQPEPGGDA